MVCLVLSPLPAMSASIQLTDPVTIKYGAIIRAYGNYFDQRDENEEAIDVLFARIAKEINIEPNTNSQKGYELNCSFEALFFASDRVNLG